MFVNFIIVCKLHDCSRYTSVLKVQKNTYNCAEGYNWIETPQGHYYKNNTANQNSLIENFPCWQLSFSKTSLVSCSYDVLRCMKIRHLWNLFLDYKNLLLYVNTTAQCLNEKNVKHVWMKNDCTFVALIDVFLLAMTW